MFLCCFMIFNGFRSFLIMFYDCAWFSYDFYDFLWFSFDFTWFAYDAPMLFYDVLWLSRISEKVSNEFTLWSYDVPMLFKFLKWFHYFCWFSHEFTWLPMMFLCVLCCSYDFRRFLIFINYFSLFSYEVLMLIFDFWIYYDFQLQ